MEVKIKLNGKTVADDIPADMLLIDFVRAHGCKSVKRGCETSACGLCTVMLDDVPVLSCSTLAARANGRSVCTLEGLQAEASEFVGFIADQGAEQCGFCNPGFVMNTIALLRENPDPTDDEILAYLSGNLCRCSGYVGQLRGIRAFLDARDSEGAVGAEGVEDAEDVEGADGLGNVDVASSAQDAPEAALSPKASGVDGAATVPAATRKAGAEGGSHE